FHRAGARNSPVSRWEAKGPLHCHYYASRAPLPLRMGPDRGRQRRKPRLGDPVVRGLRMSLLNKGRETVVIFPMIQVDDGYGGKTWKPSPTGTAVRASVQPVNSEASDELAVS